MTDLSGSDIIAVRDQQVASNVAVFYKERGGFVAMRERYLDTCNNVACVGHSHPRVVEQGQFALAQIQTNQRFLHPIQQQYLAKLLDTFPPELNTVYLVNSGSEANDLAVRIARTCTTATRPDDAIVLDGAYHGHTGTLLDLSPYKWAQATDGKNRKKDFVHVVSCPDPYSGRHIGMTEEVGAAYAREVEEIVTGEAGGVGCFIAEAAMGCVGQVLLPPGYLRRCYAAVKAAGGICIADEVQTGFGRCGTHFWMFQRHGVVPDIVTLGKPMGNGYPISAVVCRRELADQFARTGIEYFNTFGGNSVACYIAEAVLDTIFEEMLQKNALIVGDYLIGKLVDIKAECRSIGSIRGCGLFIGIEFVTDHGGANEDLARFVVEDLFESSRVISSRDGHVLKIKPPLVFSEVDANVLVEAVRKALHKVKVDYADGVARQR